MNVVTPKELINAIRWVEKVCKKNDKNRPIPITVKFLMATHDGLTKSEAQDLLEFCQRRTIYYRDCYGLGEIMFPEWIKYKFNN